MHASKEAAMPAGPYVGPNDGKHVLMRGGNVLIKTGLSGASSNLAMGTQQVLKGIGIPIHRHFEMNEAFYVVEGSGLFVLDEVSYSIEKGGSIFIPKKSWHGFENPDRELVLLWIMAPPGVEGFFRDCGTEPGSPELERTKEQINQIALPYDTEFR